MSTARLTSDNTVLWRSARWTGLLLTALLLAGLWTHPEPTLRVLWNAVIPILPAVFLIHPGLWRNVCPLATLNTLPGSRSHGLRLPRQLASRAAVVGIALLVLLVPARRFLFNSDGRALALVIAAVGVLALALGWVFDRKAGFCNAICPVLPVERLYGQAPLIEIVNAHCASCSLCTGRECLDLAPTKSIPQVLGAAGRSDAWLGTPYGAFAAAFPGFVLAYNLIPDVPVAEAASVYLLVAAGSIGSYVLVFAVVRTVRFKAQAAIPFLGAVALLLYYWFAADTIAAAWDVGTGVVVAVRLAALTLVGAWLARRLAAPTRTRVPRGGPVRR